MNKWEGGECPVAPTARVNYRLRDGTLFRGKQASVLDWSDKGAPFDIVEWEYASPLAQGGLGDPGEVLTFGSLMPKTFGKKEPEPSLFPERHQGCQPGCTWGDPVLPKPPMMSMTDAFHLADAVLHGQPAANESQLRKGMPLWAGCMMYFPDALMAVAEHSRKANDKHNPGERLHWSKGKSNDHADCAARHLTDIGPDWEGIDSEFGSLHATALAWRSLALLQTVIERRREREATAKVAA